MSHPVNTAFLESSYTYFQEALNSRYYKTARNIISEVEENGFKNEAYEMRRQLNASMATMPQHTTSAGLLRAEEGFLNEPCV